MNNSAWMDWNTIVRIQREVTPTFSSSLSSSTLSVYALVVKRWRYLGLNNIYRCYIIQTISMTQ